MEPFLLAIALALGVKHAFDADHLVAIGSILGRTATPFQAVRLSLWWSLGHLVTAGAVTAVLFLGRETFFPGFAARMELLVPLMLILVGVVGLLVAAKRLHAHRHTHGPHAHAHLHVHLNERHEAKKMGGIGLVHGLASNDELLLILTATLGASSLPAALTLVLVFSLGVVTGMVAYASALHFTLSPERRPGVAWWGNVVLSALSILYALYLLQGGQGLNPFDAWTR